MNGIFWRPMFFLGLSLVFFGACTKNGLKKERFEALTLSPSIKTLQVQNGVTSYVMNNATPKDKCYLRLVVNAGSFNEEEHESGIAHFLEHMAFDDRTVSEEQSLADWFQVHGMAYGPDANAYTTTSHTIYKIDLPSCEEKPLHDALSILLSFAQGLTFKDETIAKEKNIIDAEEREYKNTIDNLNEKLLDHLFSGTLFVSRPVLGKKELRQAFDAAMLSSFYQKWYQPKNIEVSIVGDLKDFDPAELINNTFGTLAAKDDTARSEYRHKADYKTPIFILDEPEIKYIETIFIIQAKNIIKPQFNTSLIKDRIALDIAMSMLNNSYDSQSKGSGDQLRNPILNGAMLDRGVFELSLSTLAYKNYEATFKAAFLKLRQAIEQGFNEEEFKNTKAAYEESLAQASLAESTRDSATWTNDIVDHIMHNGFAYSQRDYQVWAHPILHSLTAEDCRRVLEDAFKSGHHYLFTVGALPDNPKNIAHLTLLLKEAKRQKIPKIITEKPISFKYDFSKQPYTVTEQKAIEEIDAIKVTFGNNLEAILKPTSFKNDGIWVEVMNDEGYATMNKRDFDLSIMAKMVMTQGLGLGQHPPEQIPALLLGKRMDFSFSGFDNRLQASVITEEKDLPFILTYLRANIIDPLYSQATIDRVKEQLKVFYANMEHNMWAPIQDLFPKALSDDDHRVGYPSLSDLESITRDELLAWHESYIKSRRLKVVMVGNFSLEAAIRSLGPTFGSAPMPLSTEAKETKPLAFKAQINKIYEVATKDENSKILLRYPLNSPEKIYPDHRLRIIQDLLQELLRLKLREKKQATYSWNVMAMEERNPALKNWLDISISVKKQDAAQIKDDAIRSIERFAKRGVSAKELIKAQEPYVVQATNMLSENSYWSSVIANNFDKINSMKWILNLGADIKAIKAKDINPILNKYFRSNNVSTAIVNASDGT